MTALLDTVHNQYLSSAYELPGQGVWWIKTKQKLIMLISSVLLLKSSKSVYPQSRDQEAISSKGGSITFFGKPPQNSCWLSCTAPLWNTWEKQPDSQESRLGLCPACAKALDALRTAPTLQRSPGESDWEFICLQWLWQSVLHRRNSRVFQFWFVQTWIPGEPLLLSGYVYF